MRAVACIACGIALLPAMVAAAISPSATAASDVFIESLIARMTPQEKAGQLTLLPAAALDDPKLPATDTPTAMQEQIAEIRAGKVGALFNGVGTQWAQLLQRTAVRESRLGIPLLFSADCIHGFRTVFPVPLAEAATWEPALAERVARAAAVEMSAAGVAWNLAPNVDVGRDARWGRGVEGAGEDVLLAQRFAAARVRGYQGGAAPGRLADNDAVLATPKHFVGYGAVEGGLDYNTVELTDRSLREIHLPPFKAAIDAGALAVMAAFHDIGGIPAMARGDLIDGVLRGEWGFKGIVISDYGADHELISHGLAQDEREAAKIAFLAGVDMSMTSGAYRRWLPELVASGEVPMARLDDAVRRVLRIKQQLGLFDEPFGRIDKTREQRRNFMPQTRALARDAARRSIVMLRNRNALLPLSRSGQRLALIGPMANGAVDLNGPWTVFDDRRASVNLEDGIRAALRDASLLSVTRGSDVEAPIAGGIEAAVAAARAADVVLLAIGESESMTGEAQSRTEIVVPAAQQALADAVAAVGKPVVVLLRTGRALALQGAVRDADALLVTWFLGLQTGPAVADVLFGDYSPSGRLPVSFPQSPGQVPYYYAHRSTGRPSPPGPFTEYTARYRDLSPYALYPFGSGIGYAPFSYDALNLSADRLAWDASLKIRARVTNRGTRRAEEVVQLYVRDPVASVTRPIRELKDFRKIDLAAGQTVTVEFSLRRQDLMFVGRDLVPVAEPGRFEIWVGPSAEEGLVQNLELLPP